MRHFGYFMTESTGHLSEYLPYFRKTRKALELYCDEPAFGGETGAYYKYCRMLVGKSKSGIPCTIEMTPYQTTIDWQESALVCFEKQSFCPQFPVSTNNPSLAAPATGGSASPLRLACGGQG